MPTPSTRLTKALMVVTELTQTNLSEAAARVMAEDLAEYPEHQVLNALVRCRRELKGKLTISDVISRLEDGRPGVEEAWALIPRDEETTAVWTVEMAAAMTVTQPLLRDGDAIAARMAFRESYAKLVQQARDRKEPVQWSITLGKDPFGRVPALVKAVQAGRIPAGMAVGLLTPDQREELLSITVKPEEQKRLMAPQEPSGEEVPMPTETRALIGQFLSTFGKETSQEAAEADTHPNEQETST